MDKDYLILGRRQGIMPFQQEGLSRQRTMLSSVQLNKKSFCIFLVFNLLLVLVLMPGQIMGNVMSSEKVEDITTSLSSSSLSSTSSSAQSPDSMEDENEQAPMSLDPDSMFYMDDDSAAVRFVQEDDDFVYEDEISQHHSDLYQQNFKHGNTRIALQQEKCPPLPEPSAVANSRLCEQKACQVDEDCSRDDSVVCCYNGCIHSCLPKVNPPVAFDWVEETELKHFSGEATEENFSPRTILAAELRPETVSLPGGCHIESEQYQDLIMFRKLNHVKTCNCIRGEVFCEVLHEETALLSSSPITSTS